MKKILIFSTLMTILSLMSYAKNNRSTISAKDNVAMNFALNNATRSGASGTSRYILEVYELKEDSYVFKSHAEINTTNFIADLAPGTSYCCLFWADAGVPDDNTTGTYDASSLKNVKLNSGKTMEEAFYYKVEFVMPEVVTSTNITLKRAMAQIELIETSSVNINDEIEITFEGYNAFNVFDKSVTGDPTPISKVITATTTTGLLGTFFTFASISQGTNGAIVVQLTANYENSTAINTIDEVELSANYRTTISGKFTVSN